MVSCDVGRIVDNGNTLGIGKRQLTDAFEKIRIRLLRTLTVTALRKIRQRFGVLITAAGQKNKTGNTGFQ